MGNGIEAMASAGASASLGVASGADPWSPSDREPEGVKAILTGHSPDSTGCVRRLDSSTMRCVNGKGRWTLEVITGERHAWTTIIVEMDAAELDRTTEARLNRRALVLEYATIAWNVGEAVFTITLGSLAGSLALIGFGTVSVVEVFASSVVVWHVRTGGAGDHRQRTGRALRLIAGAFAVLAVALIVAAVGDLTSGRRPGESPWGIVYLAVTAVVMFALAMLKRRAATSLGSEPLHSEATVTFLDGVLSTTTLTGLALNAYAGWYWADPVAALLVGIAALNEARETWSAADSTPSP